MMRVRWLPRDLAGWWVLGPRVLRLAPRVRLIARLGRLEVVIRRG